MYRINGCGITIGDCPEDLKDIKAGRRKGLDECIESLGPVILISILLIVIPFYVFSFYKIKIKCEKKEKEKKKWQLETFCSLL